MKPSTVASLALAAILSTPTIAVGDDDDLLLCGDEYYLTLTPPPGWELETPGTDVGVTVTLTPPREAGADPSLLITVSLGKVSFDRIDVDDLFEKSVAGLAMQMDPLEIRTSTLRHPALPTRGATLTSADGYAVQIVIDPRSTMGYAITALLMSTRGEPSAEHRAQFERTIRSLRFDPTRICMPGPNDTVVEERVEGDPVTDSPPARRSDAPASKGQRLARRALLGCGMLATLFVPVQCIPARLDTAPAFVAVFDGGGGRSAQENLETFWNRLAVTYCWASHDHPLPKLAAATQPESGAEELGSIREYSCEAQSWTKTYAPDAFEMDFDLLEDL